MLKGTVQAPMTTEGTGAETRNLESLTIEELRDAVLEYQAKNRTLTRENSVLKSEKNRVGLSFRRVPESGSQIQALRDERFPYLEHVPELSYTLSDRRADDVEAGREPSEPTDGNVTLIEAENLAALTALQLTHQGRVDVIYIDPPYNTGSNDFVYNDARTATVADALDKDGNPLSIEDYERTLDGNVRSIGRENPERHSLWLSFMEKRLWLARHLLSDDGIVFVSIDDNEQARLKMLMDEVFGEQNFATQFIWKKGGTGKQTSAFGVREHEYVIAYAKCTEAGYFHTDKKSTVVTLYNNEDEHGRFSLIRLDSKTLGYSKSRDYVIEHNGEQYLPDQPPNKTGVACWRWSKKTLEEKYDELVFKNGFVYTKNYEKEGARPRTILSGDRFGVTRRGKKDLGSVIDSDSFQFPKPIGLVDFLVSIASTNPNATVLDFFAGSGTTAHAVAELNAEDGGSRQCILITHGDENGKNIAEDVTALRMKRVLSGKNWADGKEHDPLPGELNYYRLQFTDTPGNSHRAADFLMDKFTGYVALEQGVVLSSDQPDLEGLTLLTSSKRNVLLVDDDFLLGTPELDEALAQLRDPDRENLLYLPVEEAESYYPNSGWLLKSYPVDYLRSHLSLLTLMKNNKTLLPLPETDKQ